MNADDRARAIVAWADANRDKVLWLSAYPRSGVTWMRAILWRCFGLRTASIYTEGAFGDAYDSYVGTWSSCLFDELVARQGIVPIKTHVGAGGMPPSRTILIVRDGRTALQSLRQYYVDIGGGSTYSAEDMIDGEHPFGNWSAYVNSWLNYDHAAPITTRRYEDMGGMDLAEMGQFIGREPLPGAAIPSFKVAHSAHIWINPCGSRKNQFTTEQENRFWSQHEQAMRMLGYSTSAELQETIA